MIRITRAHSQPIGLDFGYDSVKLLQLEESNSQLAVAAAARHPIPDEARGDIKTWRDAALDITKRLLRSGEFAGKHVVVALPRDLVQVKNLRLPHMPAAELEAAVNFEARNIFPFDVDRAQIRFLHAGEVRQGSDAREEVIVLGAKNDDIDEFVEQLHRAGAIVEAIDFEPCALYRGVERFIRRREDEHEVNVLVDIGLRRTQVIIGKGRDISFFKPIEIGGEQFQDAVARKLSITPSEARTLRRKFILEPTAGTKDPVRQTIFDATRAITEELAKEISLCLRYYSVTFRGQRPTRVRLTGGEANDPHIESILTANLPLPVHTKSGLAGIDCTRMKALDRRGTLNEWSIAFGLGLKHTSGHYGSRDGKPRDRSAPPTGLDKPVEVIEPVDLPPETREVAHA